MRISVLFFVLLILEIYGSISYQRPLVLVTKPLLMPILMVLAYQNGVKDRLLYLALLFSMFGDIFLMFSGVNYFILGLASFLVAQLCYIFLFKPQAHFNFLILVGFGIYITAFLLLLYPGLSSEFRIPVIIYAMVICTMGIMAASRKTGMPKSYYWVLAGAVLFILSDSMIAINKFYTPIPKDALFVMTTYGLAQFLIVRGWIKQTNFLSKV